MKAKLKKNLSPCKMQILEQPEFISCLPEKFPQKLASDYSTVKLMNEYYLLVVILVYATAYESD